MKALILSFLAVLLLGGCADESDTATYGDSATPGSEGETMTTAPPATDPADSMSDALPPTDERTTAGDFNAGPPAMSTDGSSSAGSAGMGSAQNPGETASMPPASGPPPAAGVNGSTPFASIDADADGKLSEAEADRFPEIGDAFAMADTDKDGYLSSSEYSRLGSRSQGQ